MPTTTLPNTPHSGGQSPKAPKKSPRSVVVARTLGIILLACIVLGTLGYLATVTMKKLPLKAGDVAALVTAEALLEASGQDATPDATKVQQSRQNLLGSVELSYEYESDKPPLYVNTVVTISRSTLDAKNDFRAQSVGGVVGIAIAGEGVRFEDRDDLFKWGERSKHQRLMLANQPIGHFFIAQKGKRIFMTMFSGVYFDDRESLEALLLPRLEAMEKLEH
jgi:hypothetical protein